MENENGRQFSVGDLARICGITVRALQYYDRCGLLEASFTEGGRRVYSREDLFSLQQILFLKSFGFPLEEIKERIMGESDPQNIVKVFEKQRDILQEQMSNLQKRLETLEVAIKEARESQSVSLEKIMAILELMREGNPYTFLVRYFSGEQIKILMERSPQINQNIVDRASSLFAILSQLYAKRADPECADAQRLAQEWWAMVQDFSGDNLQLFRTLIFSGNDMDNWPGEARNIKKMIREFLSPALNHYFQKHNIHVNDLKEGNI